MLLPVLLTVILLVCKSPPAGGNPPVPSVPEEVPDPVGGHINVSKEVYEKTLAEIKVFVDQVNTLIVNKNYNGWKDALSDERFRHISSPQFLNTASDSDILKSRKIVLKTPNDYFLNVVVPSRSNSRADEIEFITLNRVKVFYNQEVTRKNENNTTTTETRRLRLYELEKSEDTGKWKIVD